MDSERSPGWRGFIQRHWRGAYSLPQSFWLNAILLSWLVPLVALEILSLNPWHFPSRLTSIAFVVILVIFYPAFFWGMFGTARASRFYLEKGGPKIWSIAAIYALTFLFIDSLYFFIGRRATVMEHVSMAFTGRYGPPAYISVIKNGTAVLLTGELQEGTAEAFAVAMKKSPTVTGVVLNSKGGSLREASLVAKNISRHDLDTFVEEECSSACTLIFLAGKRRCIAEDARIGFHEAHYARDLSGSTAKAVAEYERDLYVKDGLSTSFIEAIMETPNLRVWYPSRQELLDARVTTPNCT